MTKEAEKILASQTGDMDLGPSVKRTVSFDRFEIEIELTSAGHFLNILSVKFSKDFTETLQSAANPNIHDVEKYYKED